MVVLQFSICVVIPSACRNQLDRQTAQQSVHSRASITIQQRRGLYNLPSVPTPLALERLVGLAKCVLVEQEELPQRVD